MLFQRATITLVWIIFLQALLVQSDDVREGQEKCQNETTAFIANATGLSEAYPTNATCTFLNETHCALDLSSSSRNYIEQCYEAGGRISLVTSTAKCNWTSNNGISLFASISNDPVCISSNCSFHYVDPVTYDVGHRFDVMLNQSALDAYCDEFKSDTIWTTTLTGMCAAGTFLLQASLPEVTKPYEKCLSESCVTNYAAATEVYLRMCRGEGGNAFRQRNRMATCQNEIGAKVIVEDSNLSFCFSSRCPPEAIDEEERFLNGQWADQVAPDYQTCSYFYSAWEGLNTSPLMGFSGGPPCSLHSLFCFLLASHFDELRQLTVVIISFSLNKNN
jgi:hypothetical protein